MSIEHVTSLKALHLYGMATAWSELQAEQPRQTHRPETWMTRLIEAEATDRQLKSLRYQLKTARFPIHRDLLGIDWAETPLLQSVVTQLATAAFMETAHNLILVGGTGTGKTHLATAIGVAGITRHGRRVRFYSTVDLVVGAGANVHQIGRFENAAGQGLATAPTIGRLRLNRRATGGSPTSSE